MDKETAKYYLPLVKALAEGKTIQVRKSDIAEVEEWVDVYAPEFKLSPDHYRIKPQPKKNWYRVALMRDGDTFTTFTCENDGPSDNVSNLESNVAMDFVCWLTDRIEYEIPDGTA